MARIRAVEICYLSGLLPCTPRNIDQTDGSKRHTDIFFFEKEAHGYCSVVEVRASGVFIGVIAGTDRHI
jgi:hypothetical protein